MEELTLEQLDSLYEQVQKNEEDLGSRIMDAELDEKKKSAMAIFVKVARECDLDEFRAFAQDGELPPIALSNEEMKLLFGGDKIDKAIALASLAVSIIGMCMSKGGGARKKNSQGAQ